MTSSTSTSSTSTSSSSTSSSSTSSGVTGATGTVRAYLAAFNATDPAERRDAIAAVFTPDARYVDPLADLRGTDQLDAFIGQIQQRFPGMRFTLLGEPDAHHDVVRFTWGLGPSGEEPPIVGSDVASTTPDGRISEVHGFLDRVPHA